MSEEKELEEIVVESEEIKEVKTEDDLIEDLWGDPVEKKEEKEDKEEEKDDEKEKESDESDDKEDEKEKEVEDEKEDKEEDELIKKAREKVQSRKDAESFDEMNKAREAELNAFSEEEFNKAMGTEFSEYEVDIDGEKKNVSEIAKEYPEIAVLIKDAVARATKGTGLKVDEINEHLDNTEKWRYIETKHPGARDLGKDKTFTDWLTAQDSDVKELANSSDSGDLILVLDIYKKDSTPVKKESESKAEDKKTKLDNARKNVLAKTKGSKKPSVEKNKLSEEEFINKNVWGM